MNISEITDSKTKEIRELSRKLNVELVNMEDRQVAKMYKWTISQILLDFWNDKDGDVTQLTNKLKDTLVDLLFINKPLH